MVSYKNQINVIFNTGDAVGGQVQTKLILAKLRLEANDPEEAKELVNEAIEMLEREGHTEYVQDLKALKF
jgi:Tfp pilus assembly protein FimV